MMLRIMVLYKYRKHIEIEIVGKSQESDWQCFLLISLKHLILEEEIVKYRELLNIRSIGSC